MQEKPISKEISIDNYLIEILGEPSEFVFGHILILIKKHPENGYGDIDKTNENCEISKDEAMNILKDIGKWEDFIFVTQNLLDDLGIGNFHNTHNKNININEFEYLKQSSNNLHKLFQIRRNRKEYALAKENITVYEVINMFENINKWRKLQAIKGDLLPTDINKFT